MRLLELHIDGFGKFHDLTISFNNGINIIYGKNEAGKSAKQSVMKLEHRGKYLSEIINYAE